MTDRQWPHVSLVFLAYNRRTELGISLEAVTGRLDYPEDRLEIIVVDNASTDGTADMLREDFPFVRLIRTPENVGASAWNVGMTTAQGEWRVILDDDCYIEGDALKRAVEEAEAQRADFVSFRVMSGEVEGYSFNDEHPTGLLSFWGCSAMFNRRVIEAEPFYDPAIFIWANELELSMRLLDRGFRHLYLHEVESVHLKGPNLRFSERSTRINHRNFAYIVGKLMRPADAAGAFGNLLVHLLLQAYSEDPRALRAVPDVLWGLARGVGNRSPVRPEVSHLYRRHVRKFLSPLPLLRSPLERLGSAGSDRVEAARTARIDRWYAARPELYPPGSGSFAI